MEPAANVTIGSPYYGGFLIFKFNKLQTLSRWISILSPSGPIQALWPNLKLISSQLSTKIEHKIRKERNNGQ